VSRAGFISSFSAHQQKLQRKLGRRFIVEVHEQVTTDQALFDIDIRGANLLILSGHGGPFAMSLSRPDQRTIDASKQARLRTFLDQLAPDATIVLQSCETGQGFAWMVKEAAGPHRRVIAAKGDIPREGVEITSLEPVEVTITCRDEQGAAWDCTIRL
jgi:hypothetical protein